MVEKLENEIQILGWLNTFIGIGKEYSLMKFIHKVPLLTSMVTSLVTSAITSVVTSMQRA